MLYLEDFLEMIEQLPCELRDRSTEMRMLDLQVQRGLDQNKVNVDEFFRNAPNLTKEQRQQVYMRIKEEYKKIREQAEEKVSIADAMFNLVEKYHNRLTREVTHFKYELEADNPSITEQIEQKLAETERASMTCKRERKRKAQQQQDNNNIKSSSSDSAMVMMMNDEQHHQINNSNNTVMHRQQPSNEAASLQLYQVDNDDDDEYDPTGASISNMKRAQTYPKQLVDSRGLTPAATSSSSSFSVLLGLDHKPIDQSSRMQQQVTTPTAGASPAFIVSESRHGRPRKLTSRVQEMFKESMQRHERTVRIPTFSNDSDDDDDGSDADDGEHGEDAKRTWCICNQKSYGDMVACDSKECPFEWFHYHCVNISAPPKGKWYCPHCTETRLRRISIVP